MSLKAKKASSPERTTLEQLLQGDETAHKIDFVIAHTECSIPIDSVFLFDNETVADALMRTFSLNRIKEIRIQEICAQVLAQCDRLNISLPPSLMQRIRHLEGYLPAENLETIEDFVAVGRGLIKAGFRLLAVSSQGIDRTLVAFSTISHGYQGDAEVLAYFRPMLG